MPIYKRAELLSYLRRPNSEKVFVGYFDSATTSKKFVISFISNGQHIHNVDSSMGAAGSFVDLMWHYVLADSAQYFDTAVVITGDTLNGLPEGGYTKKKMLIHDRYVKLDVLLNVMYLRALFGFIPGEVKGTFVLDAILLTDRKPLSLPQLNFYADALAQVLSVFVLSKDYTHVPRIAIKIVGENNVLVNRFVFDTRTLTEYY